MLDDKTIFRVSIALAAAGIILLTLAAYFLQPAKIAISEIDESQVGKVARITGTIESISGTDTRFLKLSDGYGSITIVVFEREARNIDMEGLKVGEEISLTGKISLYRGEIEVILSSLDAKSNT